MKVYKLLRIKNGKLYPLFINRKQETPIGVWMDAKCYPTKGFAIRKGWHCCYQPLAPHLKMELSSGERRVWVECEGEDCEEYNRSEKYGGNWVLANKLKLIRILQ
jgi:hypothetical protein